MSINIFNKFFKENDKIFLETIQGFGLDVKNVVMDNTIQMTTVPEIPAYAGMTCLRQSLQPS
jgi:hypothetical protein